MKDDVKIRRQKIKNLLRKEQISALFQMRRKQLIQSNLSKEQRNMSNIAEDFQAHLEKIIFCLKQGSQGAVQGLARIQMALNIQTENANISTLIFSYDQTFRKIMELIINSRVEQGKKSQWLMRQDLHFQLKKRLLIILRLINYSYANEERYQSILNGFWLIFTEKIINLNSQNGLFLQGYTFETLIKMLQPSSEIVYHGLKKKGINSKLVQFITSISPLNNDNLDLALLTIIHMFLQQEKSFQNEEVVVCRVNDIYLNNDQSNLKVQQLAYALRLIYSQRKDIISKSLSVMSLILSNFQYLAHNIRPEQFRRIRDYMQFPNDQEKDIQLRSMEVIDMIFLTNIQIVTQITKEQKISIELKQSKQTQKQIVAYHFIKILDILQKQLRKQLYEHDKNSKKVIETGAVILCNLTFVKQMQLKKKLIYHKIWDLAYSSIANGHPLLCLVTTFEFLFDITPRKKILDIARSFIASISTLGPETDKRFLKSIQNTLCRLFYLFKDYFDKEILDAFISQIHSNKVQKYLQDQLGQYVEDNPI